jgi:hypothetical protein
MTYVRWFLDLTQCSFFTGLDSAPFIRPFFLYKASTWLSRCWHRFIFGTLFRYEAYRWQHRLRWPAGSEVILQLSFIRYTYSSSSLIVFFFATARWLCFATFFAFLIPRGFYFGRFFGVNRSTENIFSLYVCPPVFMSFVLAAELDLWLYLS